jgi:hypothetical protein
MLGLTLRYLVWAGRVICFVGFAFLAGPYSIGQMLVVSLSCHLGGCRRSLGSIAEQYSSPFVEMMLLNKK